MTLKSLFQPSTLATLVAASLYSSANAGIVRGDVDYQLFRDFAENKGVFKVGATNIPVYDTQHQFLGWVMKDIPMPDFSSADRRHGIATLFAPQYITSVKHNMGYRAVQFGGQGDHPDAKHFAYQLVDRNDHPHADYHIPRLHKLVTEVVPAHSTSLGLIGLTYTDNPTRFPAFARLGAGDQYVQDKETRKNKLVRNAYHYLTGGTALTVTRRPYRNNIITQNPDDLFADHYSPLTSMGQSGDSGSPLFAYDAQDKKWILVGVLNGTASDVRNFSTIPKQEFITTQLQEDIAGTLHNQVAGQSFHWTAKGNTSDVQAQTNKTSLTVPLADPNLAEGEAHKPQLNHGKTLHITGEKGSLILDQAINQGAGALHFGADFTVKGKTDRITWQGAGIIVDEGKTVDWQVLNPQGDRLSKLGKGKLIMNATGRNLGSISVGDGEVVLAQRGRNNRQPFSEIHIVSGRPTVTLADSLVRSENIYFGFRGGRLNLNGHSLVFDRIKSVDEGARIVNHNSSTSSNLYLSGVANMPLTGFGGHWGEDDPARHNGKLNVEYAPSNADSTLLFTGYANLNGNFTVGAGRAIISGKQPLHALDQNNRFNEILKDDHWENRTFSATNVLVKDQASLHITRNVKEFNANISATQHARVQLGYLPNSPICVRSDYTGKVTCDNQKTLNADIEAQLPITQTKGHIQLADHASLTIGKAHLIGTIGNSYHSKLHLTDKAKWTLTDSSKIWHIHLDDGAEITLNDQFESLRLPLSSTTAFRRAATDVHRQHKGVSKFNKLQINGNLTGTGKFNFLTNATTGEHDQVIVNGFATGDFLLSVKNSGNEVQHQEQLSLLKLNHGAQHEFNVNVTLENQEVDLGTYRYRLLNDSHNYRLHNPQKEQELALEQQRQQEQEQATQQALRAELATAQHQLAAQTQALATAQTRIQTALQDAETLRQQLLVLQRNTHQPEQVAQLRQQLSQKEAEIAQVRAHVQQLQTEKQQATQHAQQTQQQLNTQNTQLSAQLLEQQQRAERFAHQLSLLEQHLNEKTSALNHAQTQALQTQETINELRAQLEALKNDRSQTSLVAELTRQLQEKRAELLTAQQQVGQLTQQTHTAQQQVQQTSQQLRELQTQHTELTQQLAAVQAAQLAAEQAKEQAQRHFTAAEARLLHSQQEAQHQQREAKQALTQANLTLAEKTRALTQAKEQLATATQDKQATDQLLAQAKQTEQQLTRQLAEERELRHAAEQAKAKALAAEQTAQAAQRQAENAQQAAETAKQAAEQARLVAEHATQQQIALVAQATLETHRLTQALDAALAHAKQLEQQLQNSTQSTQQLIELRREKALADSRILETQHALAQTRLTKQQAEQTTLNAIASAAEKSAQLHALQGELDTALAEQQRLNVLAEQAKQAEAETRHAFSELQQRLDTEKAEHQQTRLAKIAAEQAQHRLEQAKQQLTQAMAEEQTARQRAETQATHAKQSAQRLATQVQQTRDALADAQAQLAEANHRLAQAEQRTQTNLAKLSQLTEKAAQLDTLRSALTTALNEKNHFAGLAQQATRAEAEANQTLNRLRQRLEIEKSQHQQTLREKQAAEHALYLAQQQLAEVKTQAEHHADNQATQLAEKTAKVEQAKAVLLKAQQAFDDMTIRLAQSEAEKQRIAYALQEAQLARQQAEVKQRQAEQHVNDAEQQIRMVNTAMERLTEIVALPAQRELISRYANTALSEWSAQTNMLMQVSDNLNRHLLTHHNNRGLIWANSSGLNANYLSTFHRRYAQQTTLMQLGASTIFGEKSPTQVGLVFSKSRSHTAFSDAHSATSELNMISLLIKQAWQNGIFATFSGGYGHSKTTLNSDEQSQLLKRQLWNISTQLGYRWSNPFITIQPSFGASYAHLSGVSYRLNQVEMNLNNLGFVTYQAGLQLNRTWSADKWSITPRFASYYVNAGHKQATLHSNGIALQQRAGQYLHSELGLAAQVNQWEMDLHAGLLTGNQIGKQKFAGLKISYKW